MEVKVRRACAEDEPGWISMRSSLWPECQREMDEAEITEILNKDSCAAYVAETHTGRLAGFIEVSIRNVAEGCTTDRVGYIEGWYVGPESRRKGVGRALVLAAEEWARSRGCIEMASDTETHNKASQEAHQKLGYAEVTRAVHFTKFL